MSRLLVEDLHKRLGAVEVLRGLALEAPAGKLTALLGPSGCGKTTLLRLIAGIEEPDGGRIVLGGEALSAPADGIMVPPPRRDMGMVFQSFALWPHLSVFENIAFPLRLRKLPEPGIRTKVREAMALLRLPDLAERRPAQLSGGQQQRVALARALVYGPRLLLLDEPLANLDAKVRQDVRLEVARLQREVGVTTIYVTHDQGEALSIADHVALMNEGRVVQAGPPRDLYTRPASRFAAEFLGARNILDGRMRMNAGKAMVDLGDGRALDAVPPCSWKEGDPVSACLRPGDFEIASGDGAAWSGEVRGCLFLGEAAEIAVSVGRLSLYVAAPASMDVRVGERIRIRVRPGRVAVFPDRAGPDGPEP